MPKTEPLAWPFTLVSRRMPWVARIRGDKPSGERGLLYEFLQPTRRSRRITHATSTRRDDSTEVVIDTWTWEVDEVGVYKASGDRGRDSFRVVVEYAGALHRCDCGYREVRQIVDRGRGVVTPEAVAECAEAWGWPMLARMKEGNR
jgi:hypothetical protein